MDNRTKNLIAIGAAVGANYKPYLYHCICIAKERGVDEKGILEAVEIAKLVKLEINQCMNQTPLLN